MTGRIASAVIRSSCSEGEAGFGKGVGENGKGVGWDDGEGRRGVGDDVGEGVGGEGVGGQIRSRRGEEGSTA